MNEKVHVLFTKLKMASVNLHLFLCTQSDSSLKRRVNISQSVRLKVGHATARSRQSSRNDNSLGPDHPVSMLSDKKGNDPIFTAARFVLTEESFHEKGIPRVGIPTPVP